MANNAASVKTAILLPTDGHLPDQQCRRRDGSPELEVRAGGFDVHEHLPQIGRNGDLGYRIRELTVLNPQAGCAARIIAGDDVHAGSDQFGDVEPAADALPDLFGRALALFEKKIPVTEPAMAGDPSPR